MKTQPTVYVVSCGDELLFGHTVDTNAAWLAEQCGLAGWRVLGHRTIGDVTPDIVEAFLEASRKADVVIVTGGLGPTPDDRTRSALALAMRTELREDPEALEEIAERFRSFNRPMADVNRVQALIPAGAERIVNRWGTAPGIQGKIGRARIFCLPGVPKEMKELFKQTIKPVLDADPGADTMAMRRLKLCGRGESDIGAAIHHLMGERSNPEVGTTVAESVITVRLYAKGDNPEEAARVADAAEQEIRAVFPHDIFGEGDETLPSAVHKLLAERGAKVVTAESCTGGMIADMLVDVPGVSETFIDGVVAYANETKIRRLGVRAETIREHGAVSRETAYAMATMPFLKGCLGDLSKAGTVYAIATTGVAGPGGGTPEKPVGTVWIACARLNPDGTGLTRTMLCKTLSDRHGIRTRAANAALDLLRRTILGYPSEYEVTDGHWHI